MLALLLTLCMVTPQKPTVETYRILFLGNSHTASNDLTGQVAELLRTSGARVEFSTMTGALLDDIEQNPNVRQAIDSGKWTHVVLQGTQISSSHKYSYSQDAGIALARRVKRAGSKALLFAEWPRRGWNESDYIYGHYEIIQKGGGGDIVPICYSWDEALKAQPKLDLWASDGNHSNLAGSYLASSTIAFWVAGPESRLSYAPKGLNPELANTLRLAAVTAVRKWAKR